MRQEKKKYFQYAVLGYEEVNEDKWETTEIFPVKTILETDAKTAAMVVWRKVPDDVIDKFGVANIDILVKPF